MILSLSLLLFFLLLLIFAISRWKVHPFLALLLTALALGISLGLGGAQTVEVLLQGFSETLRWIAIIIILGAFIGEVLTETGGAIRISNAIIKWVGEKKLPWAMGFTGYIVSIPVFVDVAYILFQPVTESLAVKSKRPVLFIGLALTAGLTVAHTLIPPTPGPLAVASLLDLELSKMLLINLFVATFAMIGGILWVLYYVKNSWIEYDKKLAENHLVETKDGPLQSETGSYSGNVFIDLLPIFIPIILIGLGGFIKLDAGSIAAASIQFLSLPLVAVSIGALIAILQIRKPGRGRVINNLVEQAILKSALVIMITGAGGSLGFVIRETGIQDQVVSTFSAYPFLGFLLPFLVAAILTTATGSITVSLVGTASMLGPMVSSLPMSPEITAALIGCGAFCVFHANSSFFWLLNRLHEVPPAVLYRNFTVQSLIMGLSGLVGVGLLKLMGM